MVKSLLRCTEILCEEGLITDQTRERLRRGIIKKNKTAYYEISRHLVRWATETKRSGTQNNKTL